MPVRSYDYCYDSVVYLQYLKHIATTKGTLLWFSILRRHFIAGIFMRLLLKSAPGFFPCSHGPVAFSYSDRAGTGYPRATKRPQLVYQILSNAGKLLPSCTTPMVRSPDESRSAPLLFFQIISFRLTFLYVVRSLARQVRRPFVGSQGIRYQPALRGELSLGSDSQLVSLTISFMLVFASLSKRMVDAQTIPSIKKSRLRSSKFFQALAKRRTLQ